MKGKHLQPDEQNFILANATKYHYGYIARQLGEKFPEQNGGSRSRYAVLNFLKKQEKP